MIPRRRAGAAAALLVAAVATGGCGVPTGGPPTAIPGLEVPSLGVPLALPIGALTFLLGYVPLLGATLAGAVAVAVAGVSEGWGTALWALLLVVVVQQIEGNVLAPLLLSRAIRLHPLLVLLLTTTAASAFGLLGLFVAVPVAGVLTAAVQGWRGELRRVTDDPPEPPADAVPTASRTAAKPQPVPAA